MAEAIPDRVIIGILRPFVRATRPVLDGLREADPFGLRDRVIGERAARDTEGSPAGPGIDAEGSLAGPSTGTDPGLKEKILDLIAGVEVPGTSAWKAMDATARNRWWVRRVGRFTTLIAAIPGLGGALAQRLPVAKAVGAAGQGLLLVAIAGERGVRDEEALIQLLGAVMFRRELVVAEPTKTEDEAAAERAAELTGDLTEKDRPSTIGRIGRAVWRLGRALFAVEDELDKRPHGNFLHEGMSMLPVVGVVGKYLGEWSGLKKAAAEAEKRLSAQSGGTR